MLDSTPTERHNAPLALLALLDSLPGAVAYWDSTLYCRFANKAYEAWTGRPVEQVIGMHIREVLGEHLLNANLPRILGALKGEPQAFDREVPASSDGQPRLIHVRYVPDVVAGVVRGFCAQVVDITSRREIELTLRAREAELQAAQRIARMGTWTWDLVTGRMQWSAEVYELLGLDPEFVATTESRRTLHVPGSFERAEAAMRDAVARRQAVDLEIELIPRPTGVRFLKIRGEPIQDGSGAFAGLRGVMMDVTAQREADVALREREAQVLQLQKLDSLGRLAGGIAHDFNNMLMGILGNLEFALSALGEASNSVRDALQDAYECAQRSAELTRQILTFARRQPVAPRLLDLNDLVSTALPMLRRLIGETIELSWTPSLGRPLARVDPSQVHQVLANLVVNARDAIDGGGRIVVSTECALLDDAYCRSRPDVQSGLHVALVVRDSGSGMSPEVAARIFEPFFTTKQHGTGLGLSIVHGIVAQNGGHIELESRRGEGTTFKLWFPRAESLRLDGPSANASTLPPGRETVLVVEDEPAVRNLVVSGLRHLGYTVHAAANAAEGVALAGEARAAIEVVVSDMVMPGMSGVDLVRALRERTPTLPCVFMTGYGEVELDVGGPARTQLLRKPFDLRSLAEAMRTVLAGESPCALR